MIKIFNLRESKPKRPWECHVERSTPVGNPFYLNRESERDFVCDKYKEWFYDTIHTQDFHDYLKRLTLKYKKYGKLHLFCWCAPKRCHAETIKEYLEK